MYRRWGVLNLNPNPLIHTQAFIIGIIFRPDIDGSHKQRFLHIGEVKGSRILIG